MICNPKRPDYIWRYIPRHDFKTFQRQLDHTEDQLIEFMPTKIARNYHDYQKVQRNVVIGFWVIDIPLVLYCNRIKFIQRVFSNRWAMFVFKMALVAGPLLFLMKIQKQARQQVKHSMYNIMKQGYQKYKRNGDILCLNPQIQLVQWKQTGENEQEK